MKRSEFYAMFITMIVLFTASVSFAVSYQPQIIQPTKPYKGNFYQVSASANTFYTALNITGTGILNKVKFTDLGNVSTNEKLVMQITVDGSAYTIEQTALAGGLATAGEYLVATNADGTKTIIYDGPMFFSTSLKIEVKNDTSANGTFHTTTDYALE